MRRRIWVAVPFVLLSLLSIGGINPERRPNHGEVFSQVGLLQVEATPTF